MEADVTTEVIQWLMESDEPWTRYRALVDLLGRPKDDREVQAARAEMLAHPQVKGLIAETAAWPGYALKRHNDAKHPVYRFSTLADFGVGAEDPGMAPGIEAVMSHQAEEGAFQSLEHVPKAFGGPGEDMWTWMLCDTAPELGKFRGPGRKADPCPIVNVYALKALTQVPELLDSPATRIGAEMLLWHWEHQRERKIYMFGIGTDFRKLKYPFVWYDILHVVDVLSGFPFIHADARFREMVETITAQADEEGRYVANSMYRAWKDWSFADKKNPSPWLTFLVLRIQERMETPG
jgi:hypothetical protein